MSGTNISQSAFSVTYQYAMSQAHRDSLALSLTHTHTLTHTPTHFTTLILTLTLTPTLSLPHTHSQPNIPERPLLPLPHPHAPSVLPSLGGDRMNRKILYLIFYI